MAKNTIEINIPDMLTDYKSFDVGMYKLSSFDTFLKFNHSIDELYLSDDNTINEIASLGDNLCITFFYQTMITKLHGELCNKQDDFSYCISKIVRVLSKHQILPNSISFEFRYALNDEFIIFKKNEKKA